jgi:glycosyltransferase involved in cell wall biosynthesis
VKISVIIPAYNAEPYIGRAIESCVQQTSPPDEIIVADDGSTDRTSEVALRYQGPVRVIRLAENSGASVARNRAVEASSGDWLAFLDADDWFLPNKLELQRRCIQENPHAVLVFGGYRVIPVGGSEQEGLWTPPSDLHWRLRYQCCFTLCSVMLRRDALEAAGRFDPAYRHCEDWDLWLRIAARFSAEAFAAVPAPSFVYRRVAGSLSSNAMQLFKARSAIIETRRLYQTSGLTGFFLRRKIHAFNHNDAAMAVREEGSAEDLGLILRSLALWPFPNKMLSLMRYKTAIIMLMQHLGWWPNRFRPRDARSIAQLEHKG